MPPNLIPVGGFTNLTQTVSSAAKAEIVAEFAKLTALIPNTDHPTAQNAPPSGAPPLYDKWPPELALALRTEVAALLAAINAAP